MEFENLNIAQEQAPWMRGAAFNNYWTYSFIGRSPFYAMIAPEYYDFMSRFVRNWLWWNDGYVPYFHNQEKGIPSTRLASALVEKTARKIVGGRVMFKNAGKDDTAETVNPCIEGISEWSDDTSFERTVKQAVKFAAAAGTSLVKINQDRAGKLWTEALRFDSFIPAVAPDGSVQAVDCFLRCFTDLGVEHIRIEEGARLTAFYVLERRYFADYRNVDGTVTPNAPVVEYVIKRSSGSITNGQFYSKGNSGAIKFKDLPTSVKKAIGKAYAGIFFDKPMRLPFADHLGCEIVKFTDSITGLPELPFGESILSGIISQLMSWDYYSAAANTDMYLGRGRVLMPKQMQSATGKGFNQGFDQFQYTEYQTTNPEGQHPVPIQFDLRSASWSEIRTRLIQDISIITGLNISTIASFLTDNTAARTAREISTEENETAEFINDKRALVEKPLNRILQIVSRYMGYKDRVVIRWSGAGLTNRYALAEIISMAKQGGFLSQYKAVQMFNFDDDTQQVQEEYERIKNEEPSFDEVTYDESEDYEPTAEQPSVGD